MNAKHLAAVLAGVFVAASASAVPAPLTLTAISTPFNSPIGIDYHQPTNSVLISANYPSGGPNNLERINFDGTHTPFSALSGLTDELKIATVRSGNVGGFVTGQVFTGNGNDGEIVRVSPDGLTVNNAWVSLPGTGNGLLRGSMFVDRSGVWGGDLIAVTTGGELWRINSSGTPSTAAPLASVGTHLEGLMTVPNDPLKYGPLAGKAIAGAENQGLLYAFDLDGSFVTYNFGVAIEDIDLIDANENFFGVNFGTGRILGAPASEFTGSVGKILLTSETGGSSSGLFELSWNGTNFVTTEFLLAAGSSSRGQWEHVTFAPAGIREVPPVGVPAPATLGLMAAALAGLGLRVRRSKRPLGC